MTPPELALWFHLRRGGLEGLKFRRQHPIGPWIVDFFCAEHSFAIEVDGEGHGHGEIGRDERRDADLTRRGVRVIRFAAIDTLRDMDGVLATILAAVRG